MSTISKSATVTETSRCPALFYHSAREGMRNLLESVRMSDSRGVLLPGYIGWSPHEGSGVFDPVRTLGMHPGFYGLNDDLTPDVNRIAELAATGDYGVLVVIHYFGRAVSHMAEVRRIADLHGLLLVEDLAHAFFTAMVGRTAGNYGDVNLYSLHKMFPMATGGMVTYSSSTPVREARSTAPELAVKILDYDWLNIAERRRRAFLGIHERLRNLSEFGDRFELLWPTLNDRDVPQTLPVYIVGGERDAMYTSMNDRGYGMISLYHTLINEVQDEFLELHTLSRHIINFPCHQDVLESDLDGLIQAFRTALREA